MKLWIILLTISAVSQAHFDIERCIKEEINNCKDIFVESYSKDNRGADACRDLEKTFVNCSREAIGGCYGNGGSKTVENKIQVHVDFFKDFCKGQEIYEKYYSYDYVVLWNEEILIMRHSAKVPTDKCFLKREFSCEMNDYFRRLKGKDNCRAKQRRLDCMWDGLRSCPDRYKMPSDLYEWQVEEVLEEHRYRFNQICGADPDVCAVTQWSEWFSCTKLNYEFVKYRTRSYLKKASDNTCNWQLIQMKPCKEYWKHLKYYKNDDERYRDCVKKGTSKCEDEFIESYSKSKKGEQQCSELKATLIVCLVNDVDYCLGIIQDALFDKRNGQYFAEAFCRSQKKYEKYNIAGSSDRPDLEESNKCFLKGEMLCEKDAFDKVFNEEAYSTCREIQRKHDCLWNAAVICFGQERYNAIFEALRESEKEFKELCGVDPALCPVSQWSKWSPCTMRGEEGQKFRTRRHPSPEYRFICNMTLTEKAPCTDEEPNCYIKPRYAENLHSVATNSKKCFEKIRRICRENVFEFMLRFYIFYDGTCSRVEHMVYCLKQAAGQCSEDDPDEEINEVMKEYEKQFKQHCKGADKGDTVSETALLMDMFSPGHWKSEGCAGENENFLLDCVRRVMWTGDIGMCPYWKMLFQCTVNGNGVNSTDITSSKFEEWLPVRLVKVCGAYYHRPNID